MLGSANLGPLDFCKKNDTTSLLRCKWTNFYKIFQAGTE